MIIREYKRDDLEQALNMDERPSTRRRDKFSLIENSKAFYCYVAEEREKIIGFVIMEDLGENVSHYMVQINVAKKRRGIGKQLVERVIQRIGRGGHISLCVNTDNPAIMFYESLGFKPSGFTKDYRKGQDKLWYSLSIE